MSGKDDFLDYVGYVLSEEEVKRWNSLKTDEERKEFDRTIKQKKEDMMDDWVRYIDRQVIESMMRESEKK